MKRRNYNVEIVTILGENAYMVVDQNNVIQAGQQRMSFLELAKYANFEIQQVSA